MLRWKLTELVGMLTWMGPMLAGLANWVCFVTLAAAVQGMSQRYPITDRPDPVAHHFTSQLTRPRATSGKCDGQQLRAEMPVIPLLTRRAGRVSAPQLRQSAEYISTGVPSFMHMPPGECWTIAHPHYDAIFRQDEAYGMANHRVHGSYRLGRGKRRSYRPAEPRSRNPVVVTAQLLGPLRPLHYAPNRLQ